MSKAHIVALKDAIPESKWPPMVKALCGEKVKRPRPVLDFDVVNRALRATSTILICGDCLKLVGLSFDVAKHIYGILPAEEAHRANLRKRMDDWED